MQAPKISFTDVNYHNLKMNLDFIFGYVEKSKPPNSFIWKCHFIYNKQYIFDHVTIFCRSILEIQQLKYINYLWNYGEQSSKSTFWKAQEMKIMSPKNQEDRLSTLKPWDCYIGHQCNKYESNWLREAKFFPIFSRIEMWINSRTAFAINTKVLIF